MDGTERRRFDVQNSQPTNTIRASFSKHCPVFWLCPLFSWAHHTLVRHQSMGYIFDLLHNFYLPRSFTLLLRKRLLGQLKLVQFLSTPTPCSWVAAANGPTAYGWILFGILFAWQLPHFMAIAWNHRSDYSKGGFQLHKMGDDEGRSLSFKSLIYTIILTVLVFSPYFVEINQSTGLLYLVSALLLSIYLFFPALRFFVSSNRDLYSKSSFSYHNLPSTTIFRPRHRPIPLIILIYHDHEKFHHCNNSLRSSVSFLSFILGCSRIDHKQSALDPKGLVSQNQYDIFMLSVWITIFLFCAVGGCLLFVLWKYRAKSKEEAMEIPPQSHGNSKVEVSLILASAVILVILAIPTLQGVVLLNRVPDANDEATLKKLNLDRSQIDGAITVNVTERDSSGFLSTPSLESLLRMSLFSPLARLLE